MDTNHTGMHRISTNFQLSENNKALYDKCEWQKKFRWSPLFYIDRAMQ